MQKGLSLYGSVTCNRCAIEPRRAAEMLDRLVRAVTRGPERDPKAVNAKGGPKGPPFASFDYSEDITQEGSAAEGTLTKKGPDSAAA